MEAILAKEATVDDPRGLKRICLSCSTRFFDLNKRPIICPSCGAEFTGEVKIKTRRGRVAADDTTEDSQVTEETEVEEEDEEETVEAETVSLEDVEEADDEDEDEAVTLDDDLDADLEDTDLEELDDDDDDDEDLDVDIDEEK